MKKLISIGAILLSSVVVCFAQNPFQKFLDSPSDQEFSCKFSYVTRGDIPVKGNGRVWISGDCFRVIGNGLVVLCDGRSRWSIDEAALEIYVESSDDIRDFLDDPALLLSELTSVKETATTVSGVYKYDDNVVDLNFADMKISPSGEKKKSFNPESEVKDYVSKGYTVNDLR